MKNFYLLLLVSILLLPLIGCQHEPEAEPNPAPDNQRPLKIEQALFDTQWKLDNRYEFKNGKYVSVINTADNECIGDIVSFSSDKFGTYKGVPIPSANTIYINGEKGGFWYGISDDDVVFTYYPWDAQKSGYYGVRYGNGCYFKSVSSSQLVLEWEGHRKWVYSRINSIGNSEIGANYEKPDLYFYDFSPGTTTIKVVFKLETRIVPK